MDESLIVVVVDTGSVVVLVVASVVAASSEEVVVAAGDSSEDVESAVSSVDAVSLVVDASVSVFTTYGPLPSSALVSSLLALLMPLGSLASVVPESF